RAGRRPRAGGRAGEGAGPPEPANLPGPEPMKPAKREPAKPSAAAEAARSAAALRAKEEEAPTTIGDPPATTANGAVKATSDLPAGEELAVVVEDEPTIESRLPTETAPGDGAPADAQEQPTSESDAAEVTAAISSSEIAALSGHPVPAGESPSGTESAPTGPWAAPQTGRSDRPLPKRRPGTNRLETP